MKYHVEFKDNWRVRSSKGTVGYPSWDKRVALSYAKAEAKKNRPSSVIVHDKKFGAVVDTIFYE